MFIGYHINKTNLEKSLKEALLNNANAIQLFLSSPKVWAVNNLKLNEIKLLKDFNKDKYIVIHGKYLYNFCRTQENQTNALIKELEEANKINSNVIIHQGKNVKELNLSNIEACQVFYENIKSILDKTKDLSNKPKIILENSAHQGTEIGYTLEELAYIWNLFNNEEKKRLGICIDLCHIFVAGELDMRKEEDVKLFFKNFNKLIGIENLTVIHFNDSNVKFNSHNDNHQDLLCGYIGDSSLGGSDNGFKVVVKKAKKYSIPLILETPADKMEYKDQINRIKEMI